MTVKELIRALQSVSDPDMEVKFAYDYGDRSHTNVCDDANCVEELDVIYSEYFNRDRIVDADEDEKPDARRIVVIQ